MSNFSSIFLKMLLKLHKNANSFIRYQYNNQVKYVSNKTWNSNTYVRLRKGKSRGYFGIFTVSIKINFSSEVL